jgi:cell wall-associated NlpC family hydrolase
MTKTDGNGSTRFLRLGRWPAGILAALACFLLAVVVTRPAEASPGIPDVPDGGARPPAAAAGLPVNGTGTTVPVGAAGLSPLAQQIQELTTSSQTLAEQLKQADAAVTDATATVAVKQKDLDAATEQLDQLRNKAAQAATDAYKRGNQLGPFGGYASDLHRLSKVNPVIGSQPGGDAAARDVARAEEAQKAANRVYLAARNALTIATNARNGLKTTYDQKTAALLTLRTQRGTELAQAEAEQDAYERSVGVSLNLGAGSDGWEPNPLVAKVLNYAVSKLGKPYVWGDEGPNTYDCSGLVWDSYRQVGKMLPRIANEQYNATTKIARENLLAGDLVFFGPPGSWVNIYHVGIYIGGGRMIQAPTTGDVVKISSVTWSRFYGATRVLPAQRTASPVVVPTTNPAPPSSSSPASSASPSVSHSGGASSSSKPPSSSSAPASGGASSAPAQSSEHETPTTSPMPKPSSSSPTAASVRSTTGNSATSSSGAGSSSSSR